MRGNLLILKGQWPGTGSQKKSNIAEYFETPSVLVPFVLRASKSVVCCGLNPQEPPAEPRERAGGVVPGSIIVMQQRTVVNKFDRVQPPGTHSYSL